LQDRDELGVKVMCTCYV